MGDNECGLEGFHGETTGTPGEDVVSQAAFYVKRNNNIPGLAEATTWLYDTTQIDDVNDDFDPTLGLEFRGAQLVDSEGLCLTRGLNAIGYPLDDPTDPDYYEQFIIYVDNCIDYGGLPEDGENIDALKR